MSGVPQKPYQFANTGNYPAGANPWNATPTRVAPGLAYLTPGSASKPTAQGLNYVMGQNSDAALALWKELGAFACQNWRGTQGVAVSGNQWNHVCYDPSDNTWNALVRTTGSPDTVTIAKSYDGGKTWVSWQTSSGVAGLPVYGPSTGIYPLGIRCGGPGVYVVATFGQASLSTYAVSFSLVISGVWTLEASFNVGTSPSDLTGVTSGYDADISFFGPTTISCNNKAKATSGSQTGVYSSSNGGGTWAAQAFPTTLGDSSTHVIPGWTKSAQSSAIWLIMQRGLTGTACGNQYMYTTDGLTFLSHTLPGGVQGASDMQAALAYGPGAAGNGLFMCAVQVSGGGTRFATSADGLTWTAGVTLTSVNVTDLVSFGSAWVAVVDAEASGGSNAYIIYSLDDGATWQRGSAILGQNASTSTAGYCRAKIAASPMGLCFGNTAALDLSFETGNPGVNVS